MGNRTMVGTAQELEECLQDFFLDQETLEGVDGPEVRSAHTFESVGMLTRDRGLVVRLRNGTEFQITIVQSGEAEGTDEDEGEEGETTATAE